MSENLFPLHRVWEAKYDLLVSGGVGVVGELEERDEMNAGETGLG